jgi:hypothetical protein
MLRCLSELWGNSQNNHLLKRVILRALTRLVKSLPFGAVDFHDFMILVIQQSTNLDSSDSVYLLEIGLPLWLNTLRNSPTLTPALFSLYPTITRVLTASLEYLKPCLKIMEAYCLLGKNQFLMVYISEIVSILTRIAGDVKDQGTKMLMQVCGTLVQLYPEEIPQHLELLLQKLLVLIFSGQVVFIFFLIFNV